MPKRTKRGVLCNVLFFLYGACRPASARAIPSYSEGTVAGPCAVTFVSRVNCLFVIVHSLTSAFLQLTCQRRHDQTDFAPRQLCLQDQWGAVQTSMRTPTVHVPAFRLLSGAFQLCLQDSSTDRYSTVVTWTALASLLRPVGA